MQTINLHDGYCGHLLPFYTEPVEREKGLVKLRCAEPGLTYCTRWVEEQIWIDQLNEQRERMERHQPLHVREVLKLSFPAPQEKAHA